MSEPDFIHRFIAAPESAGSGRVLLLLHGTGGNEDDLLPLGREIDPGAALLSPRGQVLEQGRPRFFRRLSEGVFDEADVIFRAQELAGFLAAAAAQHGFGFDDMIAVGYSNGANIAAAMMLLGVAKFRRAILLRAMVPLRPATSADLSSNRALLASGLFDRIIPPENGDELAALLEQSGTAVTVARQAADHGLVPADVVSARRWLAAP